mmetsp:Transcript_13838/g.27027  ORF Transcript_13838/g.27027 Transcript_13838/m.27027 type:complete len:662 (-) Transcript_13838:374-2359(-)
MGEGVAAKYAAFARMHPRRQQLLCRLVVLFSVALVLGEQLLLHVGRDDLVVVKLHGVGGTALGDRAQLRHVLEHVGKRHPGAHHLHVAALGELGHHATPAVDVADDVAHGLLRHGDLDLHDGLHELGASLAQALACGGAAGDLEGHDGGVDVVVGAVEQRRLAPNHGEAGENAVAHHRLQALGDAGDVLLWHGAALDLLLEHEARGRLVLEGFELDDDLGELARAARLLLVRVLNRARARDGLAVRNLRWTDVALDLEFALHAIADNLEVELAHALDHGLSRVFVAGEPERGVLLRQLDERHGHLLLVALRVWLDGHFDHRLGELHLLEDDGVGRVAERLAGGGILAANEGDDVAGDGRVKVGAVVGVHLEHAANALALVLDRVEDRGALLEDARVDARKGKGADEGVGHDLKGECGKGLLVGRLANHRRLAILRHALDVRNVGRRGHVVHNRVEQRLHTLVLEGGAREHGHEVARDRALADELLERLGRGHLALKVGHQRLLVLLDGQLDELLVVLCGLVGQVARDVDDLEVGAQALAVPHDTLHGDKVDNALEVGLSADWQLQHRGRRAKQLDNRLDAKIKVGAGAVHLIQETHARHAILISLAPDGFRLWLHAGDAVEHGDGAVEHAQRSLNLQREVDVARRIDDVDAVVLPVASGRS